jgi:tetratricopeptide (TPR) repeat protein
MMALVDPYSPCPCGSGQKYKWCCQKVEAYVERAQRLLDSGQYESALKPLDEGLAQVPDNVSLLFRKALVHLHLNQVERARLALRLLLQKHPAHLGGSILLTRLALETEGPAQAVSQFQQALSARRPEDRGQLGSLASFLGSALASAGFAAAAIKHLELAGRLSGGDGNQAIASLQSLRARTTISAWEKNPYRLSPPPDHVSEPFRESFERALGWAEEGLWSAAASAFELLAAGSGAGALADRNRGLCCLWLADLDGAAKALRRYIARTGPSGDAVELEALCQIIAEDPPHDPIEFVQLTWPIRNREGLLSALRANPSFEVGTDRNLIADDSKSPEVQRFYVLDRPRIVAKPGLTREEIPLVDGEVLVAADTVVLEAYDDGRLDQLSDRFTAAAGSNIPPSHPRTKVIGHEQRHLLALSWQWQVPPGLAEADAERLGDEQMAHVMSEIWPRTPHPWFRGKSPLEAGQSGAFETSLRAAVLQMEGSHEGKGGELDWNQFRSKLHVKPEPAVDPQRVDIDQIHLSRLSSIPIEQLDDDRILALYRRAREWGLRRVMNRVARLIDQRPSLMVKGQIENITLYGDLALEAAQESDRAQAASWIARGRGCDPPQKRSAHALGWEMIELQVEMIVDEPEVWVGRLAVILERYRGNQEATSAVLLQLVSLGLVQARVDPKRPDQLLLDTSAMDSLLSQYGPRVTTAAGELGAAATQGGIWTPDSAARASPIWTPGSGSPSPRAAEKSKLILPGQ